MLFASFYQKSAISDDLIEACGDRSVIILDARLSPSTNGYIAASECEKRGYVAWRINKGDTFTRSSPISCIHRAPSKQDNSAMSATHGA